VHQRGAILGVDGVTVVTLFDVDNTLVDNDHIVADMHRHL
jgi:hypothetical protein